MEEINGSKFLHLENTGVGGGSNIKRNMHMWI
jgi:hypothetical protein